MLPVRPSFANVTSLLALVVAMSGTTYAAVHLGKGAVKGRNLASNSVTSSKVKNGSLLARDFRAGQLPAGAQGPKGDPGAQGPKGDPGPATGPAGGDLTGSYPNPAVAADAIGPSKLATLPMARIRIDSGTTIGGGNGTPLPGNETANESYDTAGLHSDDTNPTYLTAPVAGTYVVTGSFKWGSNGVDHGLMILKNGSAVAGSIGPPSTSFNSVSSVSAILRLAAGDHVELAAAQSSGTSLSASDPQSAFAMAFAGP